MASAYARLSITTLDAFFTWKSSNQRLAYVGYHSRPWTRFKRSVSHHVSDKNFQYLHKAAFQAQSIVLWLNIYGTVLIFFWLSAWDPSRIVKNMLQLKLLRNAMAVQKLSPFVKNCLNVRCSPDKSNLSKFQTKMHDEQSSHDKYTLKRGLSQQRANYWENMHGGISQTVSKLLRIGLEKAGSAKSQRAVWTRYPVVWK